MTAFSLFTMIMGSFDLEAFSWCDQGAYSGGPGSVFILFQNDAAALLCFASLLLVIFDIRALKNGRDVPKIAAVVKFVASTASFFSFVLVYCIMLPKNGFDGVLVLDWRSGLWVNTISPLLCAISFAFVERKPKLGAGWTILGMLPLGIYAAVVLPLIKSSVITAVPYFFLDFAKQPAINSWSWCLGLLAFTYLIGLLFYLVRKGMGAYGDNKSKEKAQISGDSRTNDDKSVKVLRIVDGKKAPASLLSKDAYRESNRIYHISKHRSGNWQVKLAMSVKPIKLFSTQEGAINFAKELVKTQGGSIRIHSMAGKIRKDK